MTNLEAANDGKFVKKEATLAERVQQSEADHAAWVASMEQSWAEEHHEDGAKVWGVWRNNARRLDSEVRLCGLRELANRKPVDPFAAYKLKKQ